MGMYTEVLIKGIIKEEQVDKVRKFMSGDFEDMDTPEIQFICSYYHFPRVILEWSEEYLFFRCDIKNYHGQIEEFLDWLVPKMAKEFTEPFCVGWYWYEEDPAPKLIIKNEDNWLLR